MITNPRALIVVRMLVAPLPIVQLIPAALVVVCAVSSMVLYQVAPVGPILMVIPIMIVAMVAIIDSHLNAALLRTGRC